MQAVILAGGLGTRMKEVSQDIPKSMMLIGDKPLLEHQINLLRKYGIENIVLIVNHLKEAIQVHFGNGSRWGVEIAYYEEKTPLGTVGGIKACEDHLEDDFIVLYGDVMVDMNLLLLVEYHFSTKSDCTLVLHPNDHPFDSDLVELDRNNKIVGFHPKPRSDKQYYRNMVNAGLYVMSKRVLNHLERNKKADFGRDIFPLIMSKVSMTGYNTSEYLKDMGTPERLEQVRNDYESGKIEKRNFINRQKAIFLDRDGVINIDVDLVAYPEELEIYPDAPATIKKINESDYLAIVITNQSVVARNLCTEDELRIIHNKLDTVIGAEHAKLDGLYYCPHHPHGGFPEENPAYKIDCHCRKPKPGMLLDAARDFNLDLSQCWFIGDTERDVVAGKAAGVKTIGVKTGRAMKGSTVQPDFMFDDLKEAVNFILGLK
jgi:D,D-heptose 1,7-bisphosphate phosphatase